MHSHILTIADNGFFTKQHVVVPVVSSPVTATKDREETRKSFFSHTEPLTLEGNDETPINPRTPAQCCRAVGVVHVAAPHHCCACHAGCCEIERRGKMQAVCGDSGRRFKACHTKGHQAHMTHTRHRATTTKRVNNKIEGLREALLLPVLVRVCCVLIVNKISEQNLRHSVTLSFFT